MLACGRPTQMTWARTPAAGRPASCPDDAVDLTGDHLPVGDHLRCSYADAERGVLRVQGTVLPAAGGALARGLADTRVTLVRMGDAGASVELAHTTSDAQGRFSLQTRAAAGEYRLVAGGGGSPPLVLEGRGPWTHEDLRVLVP